VSGRRARGLKGLAPQALVRKQPQENVSREKRMGHPDVTTDVTPCQVRDPEFTLERLSGPSQCELLLAMEDYQGAETSAALGLLALKFVRPGLNRLSLKATASSGGAGTSTYATQSRGRSRPLGAHRERASDQNQTFGTRPEWQECANTGH
jgi:hypothetical protein